MAFLLLYVDDIIITASSDSLLQNIIKSLSTEFKMTDLGNLHHFLGIAIQKRNGGLFLSQSTYASDILARVNMSNCKSVSTPVGVGSKLSADTGTLFSDSSLYRSLAGALQYLTITISDKSYAVQQVCLFMHAPREPHFNFSNKSYATSKGLSHMVYLFPPPNPRTSQHILMRIGVVVPTRGDQPPVIAST
ncbi:uncharacterized mitochondrial protein AtMg00810-like [Helianthus annuus]|uniref:uncharacterized mitochondrial protein AtMg00810-like n=1 Tax=Helianthus annuus TaxID=4232 RepID=UPI000B8F769A|nr:uncharacterized mitochondrial protein AtMg00810-like [Helianthus annuus]